MDSTSPLPPRPMEEVIRSAFDDLNLDRLAAMAKLSPEQRMQTMFDLIEAKRQMQYADEQQRDPTATEAELWKRVRRQIELEYDAETIQGIRKTLIRSLEAKSLRL